MNALSRRLLLLGSAALSAAIAVVVIYTAGLPLRLDYASYLAYSGDLLAAPEIGARAPQFDLPRIDGPRLRLADLSGSPVVLNFWATWCAPCRVEMPALQAAYDAGKVTVLAVNAGEPEDAIQAYMDELGLTFPAVLDPSGDILDLYGVRVFPTTVWVDRQGIVRAEHLGPLTADLIDQYSQEMAGP